MLKHYAIDGRYYGLVEESPEGAIEVPSRPLVDSSTWNGTAWLLPSGGDWVAGFCDLVDADANARAARVATEYHALNDIMLLQLSEALMLTLSADQSPTAEKYPLLASIVDVVPGLTSLADAASYTISTAQTWGAAVGAINRVRLIAKEQIAACTTSEQLHTIRDGIVWPQ